tara:strand:+ start:643 stop:1557 length:915 start_codon:yes stop_codon:yes gene_type:complete
VIRVLALFDGISCGRVALDRLNIPISEYYSSEIDKYAIAISDYQYPDNIKLGDINDWESWNLDYSKIDLILAGFPCQSWSANGQLQGIEDTRGKLIYPMLKILEKAKEANPNVRFLLENVKMKTQFQEFVNKLIGVEPILINSSLLSAQNRERLYWTNIPNVSQPNDLGLCMSDILETKRVLESLYYNVGADYTGKTTGHVANLHIKIHETEKRVYSEDYKSSTLTTMQGGHRQPKVLIGDVNGEHIMRRLTPLECERLQTLDDDYTLHGIMNDKVVAMSNSQRYKTVGNGWTVYVIAHILKNL